MNLAHYLALLHRTSADLGGAFSRIGEHHAAEPDVLTNCRRFAAECAAHVDALGPFAGRYGESAGAEPDRLHFDIAQAPRSDPLGLLRDLHDLYAMASACDIAWTLVAQAAQGLRDKALLGVVHDCELETALQLTWLRTRMKTAAPQVLVVAADSPG
jgi:hypothetical protein